MVRALSKKARRTRTLSTDVVPGGSEADAAIPFDGLAEFLPASVRCRGDGLRLHEITAHPLSRHRRIPRRAFARERGRGDCDHATQCQWLVARSAAAARRRLAC